MKMKTYPQRARAAALREIEESNGEKNFNASTENNTLDMLRRMKDEGLIKQTTSPYATPTYRLTEDAAVAADTPPPIEAHCAENLECEKSEGAEDGAEDRDEKQ